jgi:hypothetical protein
VGVSVDAIFADLTAANGWALFFPVKAFTYHGTFHDRGAGVARYVRGEGAQLRHQKRVSVSVKGRMSPAGMTAKIVSDPGSHAH